jgi:hypothetical protein
MTLNGRALVTPLGRRLVVNTSPQPTTTRLTTLEDEELVTLAGETLVLSG